MPAVVIERPPIALQWMEMDDDLPNCPEPPWPVPSSPLDSAQSRRALVATEQARSRV